VVNHVIYLRNEDGAEGYLFWLQDPSASAVAVCKDMAGAALFEDEDAAETEINRVLRCEGFEIPLYVPTEHQCGFSSHSRSNS
jgi:hypothetical protein